MRRTCFQLCLAAAGLCSLPAHAQVFNSGSTGLDGNLDVAENTTFTPPAKPNGVYHYGMVRVRSGATLRFDRNAANSPIHLLATNLVLIEGTVDVSGGFGNTVNGGKGGPGGYDGGKPGIAGKPPGAGHGPGGGKGGAASADLGGAGGGSYATIATASTSTNKGSLYGSDLLLPLVGGSGGGGQPGLGGSGGGGAILIASSTEIQITSTGIVKADGGHSGADWGYGSGGAVRLVAERVTGSGNVSASGFGFGGDGRIRVDLINRDNLNLTYTPNAPGTLVVGTLLTVFPPVSSQLDITKVGSQTIEPGLHNSIVVNLPPGTPSSQNVEVQARDFNRMVPITIALIPDSGSPSFYNTTLDNVAANPVTKPITVSIPANTLVRVMAWTR